MKQLIRCSLIAAAAALVLAMAPTASAHCGKKGCPRVKVQATSSTCCLWTTQGTKLRSKTVKVEKCVKDCDKAGKSCHKSGC